MSLTHKRIAQLAEKPGVQTHAAENFLQSLGPEKTAALANLELDAHLYGWNPATRDAIRIGIDEAYS